MSACQSRVRRSGPAGQSSPQPMSSRGQKSPGLDDAGRYGVPDSLGSALSSGNLRSQTFRKLDILCQRRWKSRQKRDQKHPEIPMKSIPRHASHAAPGGSRSHDFLAGRHHTHTRSPAPDLLPAIIRERGACTLKKERLLRKQGPRLESVAYSRTRDSPNHVTVTTQDANLTGSEGSTGVCGIRFQAEVFEFCVT